MPRVTSTLALLILHLGSQLLLVADAQANRGGELAVCTKRPCTYKQAHHLQFVHFIPVIPVIKLASGRTIIPSLTSGLFSLLLPVFSTATTTINSNS